MRMTSWDGVMDPARKLRLRVGGGGGGVCVCLLDEPSIKGFF